MNYSAFTGISIINLAPMPSPSDSTHVAPWWASAMALPIYPITNFWCRGVEAEAGAADMKTRSIFAAGKFSEKIWDFFFRNSDSDKPVFVFLSRSAFIKSQLPKIHLYPVRFFL